MNDNFIKLSIGGGGEGMFIESLKQEVVLIYLIYY